ncbi:MAG TPA: nucleotidyltransferase domain-containing protein, partial [Acidimicrobiia bacterium]|nr:nucleotidyltransferase domain-containing protein [Acidimicrobiia bacterium]
VRRELIEMARQDERIIAGAEVGSLTQTTGDRWSDLDLTFGVTVDCAVDEVLRDWTDRLEREHAAVRLFDLRAMDTIYRVFLFPGWLQVDLSFTPDAVAQTGPKFKMLFGEAVREYATSAHDPREIFGLCVHHALRARLGIERGRLWSAQYYIHELRHETLAFACLRRRLPSRYARGFDELPRHLLSDAEQTLPASVEPTELLRALRHGIALFIAEAEGIDVLVRVVPALDELAGERFG